MRGGQNAGLINAELANDGRYVSCVMSWAIFYAVETESEAEGCFPSLTVYKRNFERPLIKATEEHHAEQSERLFREMSIVDFATYVS